MIGATGAGLAYLSGNQAEDSLGALPAATQALVSEHADWGLRTLLLFSVLALARLGLAWLARNRTLNYLLPLKLLIILVAIFGQWVLFQTADRGGALVYQRGVAVTSLASAANLPSNKTEETKESAENGAPTYVTSQDGTISWQPRPDEVSALGAVLRPAPGVSAQAVKVIAAESSNDSGLGLKVSGRSLLLLPGSFGDLILEVQMDLSRFEGIFGLAHHVEDISTFQILEVNQNGQVALAVSEQGVRKVLDQGSLTSSSRATRVAVSATESHYKGLINDKVIVHGHHKPLDPSGAGIFLEGSGVIRLLTLRLTPVRHY